MNQEDSDLSGLPNFFIGGCQKTASTWLYRCFCEHPEIYVPENDATHYFTMNYFQGLDWYRKIYQNNSGEKVIGDTTPSYIRDFYAPARIAKYNPQAKIIFTFRNPIDRAFSHYWHEKKKRKIAFEFSEVLENYDLYENWIVSGFYYQHLTRFYDYFDKYQILVLIYDDLKKDPYLFIKRIFEFLEVDPNFIPSVIEQKINVAWHKPGEGYKRNKTLSRIKGQLKGIKAKITGSKASSSEYYDIGIPSNIRVNLQEIFFPENKKLAQLIERDLSHWT